VAKRAWALIALAGEMLDDEWRVKSITRDAVVLLHLPLKVEQRVEAN